MHVTAAQLGEIEPIAASVKATPPSADVLICLPATLIDRAVHTAARRAGLLTIICVGETKAQRQAGKGCAFAAIRSPAACPKGWVHPRLRSVTSRSGP
jgi:hypothetical protein